VGGPRTKGYPGGVDCRLQDWPGLCRAFFFMEIYMVNRVYGIRLNARQAWVWKRLGNQPIRDWLAPEGLCVECRSHSARPTTRNGWFCYLCHDSLSQLSLLPHSNLEVLEEQNRDLYAEINKLRAQLNESNQKPDPAPANQLSLFEPDS